MPLTYDFIVDRHCPASAVQCACYKSCPTPDFFLRLHRCQVKHAAFVVQYLDGPTLQAALALNKPVKKALQEETSIYTRDNPRFIHGAGFKAGQ